MVTMQMALIGDLLVVAEGDLGAPASFLADFESGDLDPGSVEEAAAYGAWTICHKPFPKDNGEIGYRVMLQMLEESGHPWPRPHEDVIEKMIEALEAGTITEAEFVDWVCLRVVTA
jgi:hypothetical protein